MLAGARRVGRAKWSDRRGKSLPAAARQGYSYSRRRPLAGLWWLVSTTRVPARGVSRQQKTKRFITTWSTPLAPAEPLLLLGNSWNGGDRTPLRIAAGVAIPARAFCQKFGVPVLNDSSFDKPLPNKPSRRGLRAGFLAALAGLLGNKQQARPEPTPAAITSHRLDGGRHRHRSLRGDRCLQPRAGPTDAERRRAAGGGGVKPGITLGKTDDFGFNPVEDRVHVHDLHATLLHLLGFDHTKLTYKFQGRQFRLTDVKGKLVNKLLA